MGDAGPRSLFALVYYYGPIGRHPTYYSILELHHVDQKTKNKEVDEKVRFNLPQKPNALSWMKWSFSLPTSSTKDLCMVPNWRRSKLLPVKPFHGCKLDIRTGSFLPINLSDSYSFRGNVVNLEPHIYYVSRDLLYDSCPVVFQCYDPDKNSWKALEPFPKFPAYEGPYDGDYKGGIAGRIAATAVWVDTILLNVHYFGVGSSIWAYVVSRNKWYPVEVDNDLCELIEGAAVVIGNTIYALTATQVLALSVEKKGIDDHLVFKCSLLWVEYMKPILSQHERAFSRTRHLVHLGKYKFCVVQSVDCGIDCQPIQLTYLKIKRDNPAIVIDEYFHQVKIQHTGYFTVQLCFSLPKGALKEGKSFNLDPYNEDFEGGKIVTLDKDRPHATSQRFQDNDSSERNIIDEEADRSSIYVRKLPHNASVRHVRKSLRKFGPIKSDGIRVGKDEEGNRVARVEFESRSAKSCAIEEPTIRIRDCLAEITEERLTCLTLGPGSRLNRTQAVGSNKKKIKNHGNRGEVSRCKTTGLYKVEEMAGPKGTPLQEAS